MSTRLTQTGGPAAPPHLRPSASADSEHPYPLASLLVLDFADALRTIRWPDAWRSWRWRGGRLMPDGRYQDRAPPCRSRESVSTTRRRNGNIFSERAIAYPAQTAVQNSNRLPRNPAFVTEKLARSCPACAPACGIVIYDGGSELTSSRLIHRVRLFKPPPASARST